MQRILVTGASGFVGRHLCRHLVRRSNNVRGALHESESATKLPMEAETIVAGEIGPHTDWRASLENVDTIVHLAARVHVLDERSLNPLEEFRRVNVAGMEHLARAAAGRVRRLVLLSSVHAMCTLSDELLDETISCRPESPYGRSKWEAEQALRRIAGETGLEWVILRPPPVYGPGQLGNLARLFNWIGRGLPLPLLGTANRRSLIYVGNLVDAIATCVNHPRAAGETFLVGDEEIVSTVELMRKAAVALHRPARLVPAPLGLLRLAGRCTGRQTAVERLLGSLAVSTAKIRSMLDWRPPHTMTAGLAATARWMRNHDEAIV